MSIETGGGDQHRVYATATGTNQMVTLDEDTGAELGRAATGEYPDGLAYDPQHTAEDSLRPS